MKLGLSRPSPTHSIFENGLDPACRSKRWKRLALAAGALLLCSALTGCQSGQEENKPIQANVVVRLVHDPEVRALLSAVKERFYLQGNTLSDGTPFALELVPELNVPAARRLASGDLKAEAWITPLRSLAEYVNQSVAPLGAAQVECRPLFRTPMVMVAPAHLVGQLRASDGQVSWTSFIEQLSVDGGALGNAPIGYSHGFPEFAASGPMVLNFLARLAQGGRATAEPASTLQPGPIDARMIKQLQDWQRWVSHYSISEGYLMERVARSTLKRLYVSLASEQQLRLFQRNQREDAPKVLGLVPEEGTIWSTYQLCMSDAPWVTAAHRSILSKLGQFFASSEGSSLPASFGFRPVAPAVGSTERVPGDLGELTGKQLGELLTRWPKEIMKPGALMLVLDSSGSMEGEPLRASKESIRNLLPRLDPRDQVGFLTFGSDVKDRLAVGTKLQSIFEALDAVQPVGGSSAYDALKAGMDELSAPSLNGYRRTLIMITDGEGLNSELSLQGIQDYLSSRLSRYDVNIQIIALKREGADFSDLEKIARGVNGYFRAATAAELMGIIQEAMRNV